ncbi:MAG TPA: hypothetical protein VET87_05360 [Rubrivivax sp.]|nr:hypothetical protein [Rubrivivax sp.]
MNTRMRCEPPAAPPCMARPAGTVTALDAARIERALARRTRYRYVQPRVRSQGAGWRIVSPNCSRQIDPGGGEIDIAWFEPSPRLPALWRLHRRDHGRACWVLQTDGLTLADALAQVCSDPLGVYWP